MRRYLRRRIRFPLKGARGFKKRARRLQSLKISAQAGMRTRRRARNDGTAAHDAAKKTG